MTPSRSLDSDAATSNSQRDLWDFSFPWSNQQSGRLSILENPINSSSVKSTSSVCPLSPFLRRKSSMPRSWARRFWVIDKSSLAFLTWRPNSKLILMGKVLVDGRFGHQPALHKLIVHRPYRSRRTRKACSVQFPTFAGRVWANMALLLRLRSGFR